jgi:hypothetical protein
MIQHIDTEFLNNNIPNIIFYIFYNTYTSYLFWTNTYYKQEYLITYIVGVYEFLNIFYELRNKTVKKEMVVHHTLTSANSFLLLYYYTIYPEFIRDVMYCQTLIMMSTFYLNIRYIFPHAWLPRLVFFVSFFYYRFYLIYPYIYKCIGPSEPYGSYAPYENDMVIRIIYVNIGSLYCLSIFWGCLILRIAYKALVNIKLN